MLQIKPGFDAEMNMLTIGIEARILDKYFCNLKGMFEIEKSNLPKGIKINKVGKNEVEISFTSPSPMDAQKINDSTMRVAIEDKDGHIRNVHKLINTFINSAVKKEYQTHEFMPLRGYPLEDLKKDMIESAKNKRNLVVIKDYQEYLTSQKEKDISKVKFTQYILEYGTSGWADFYLEVLDPKVKLEDLEKKYLPLCKPTDWL